MENRKNLHDVSLALIFVGICHLFTFIATVIDGIIEGDFTNAFTAEGETVLTVVKVLVAIICVFYVLIVSADLLIGLKGLKVSKNPTSAKGHIVAATIFLVINLIGVVSSVISLFDGSVGITDGILSLATTVLGACLYIMYISAAKNVRKEVLNDAK